MLEHVETTSGCSLHATCTAATVLIACTFQTVANLAVKCLARDFLCALMYNKEPISSFV